MNNTEKSWEAFLREAREYHKTACSGRQRRPEIFTNEIVFNMLGMVIEKYFMAFLMQHGEIADNHTFTDLVESARRVRPVPQELAETLCGLDGDQNLCPLYDQQLPEEYTDTMVDRISGAADAVRVFAGYAEELPQRAEPVPV